MTTPVFFDIDRNEQPSTWKAAWTAAQRIKAFFDALKLRFPGRDEVVTKMMYALMTRHHMLITGPHGAAKTLLINTVLDSITGDPAIWREELTKSHTPAHLFGPLDVKAYRETGRPVHITQDTLSDANFARLGEMLDANDYTLRAMLGALHERRIRIGLHQFSNPLMTAFADTNFRLEDEPHRVRELSALWDRFLFQAEVQYLATPGDRIAMFQAALENKHETPVGELILEDIILVSGLVRAMNLVQDPYVVSAFEEATRGLREGQRARNEILISDRRQVQALTVMEVHALLRGRREVTFEDVDEARIVLCGNQGDTLHFEEKVPGIISAWTERGRNRELLGERQKLEAITETLPPITSLPQMESEHELQELLDGIQEVLSELSNFTPVHAVIRREQREEFVRIEEALLAKVQQRYIEVLASALPEAADSNADANGLRSQLTEVRRLREMVSAITPVRDFVRTTQREVENRAIDLLSQIETQIVA